MEIKITTKQTLQFLHILSWIIFIGLCVETGSFLFNAAYVFNINPAGADYFKLTELFQYDSGQYLVIITYMTIIGILKTLLFFLIAKLLYEKKLDMEKPFNTAVVNVITLTVCLSLGIALFSDWGNSYALWLSEKVKMPGNGSLHFEGADVWVFMAVVLLVIRQIFKRGIEIQTENELTV